MDFNSLARQSEHNQLKDLITNEVININHKGKDAYNTRNIINIICTSNNDHPVKYDEATARRFFTVRTAPPQSEEYYRKLVKEIQSDGFYNALYYYLLNYDI